MDDRLALLVGRVILAWGALDQQMHQCIYLVECGFRVEHTREGRFNQRRSLFRRYHVRLADEETYSRALDQFLTHLQKLETLRGQIAHGWVTGEFPGGGRFREFPTADADNLGLESGWIDLSYGDLERLATDIRAAMFTLGDFHRAAKTIAWQRENPPTQER
jgi:hypothetical protein